MWILEKLHFKISRGSMPPDPSTVPAPLALNPILVGSTLYCFRRACIACNKIVFCIASRACLAATLLMMLFSSSISPLSNPPRISITILVCLTSYSGCLSFSSSLTVVYFLIFLSSVSALLHQFGHAISTTSIFSFLLLITCRSGLFPSSGILIPVFTLQYHIISFPLSHCNTTYILLTLSVVILQDVILGYKEGPRPNSVHP